VVQNTPYIGHPAYKAMGARAGYTLATAIVIGVGAAAGAVSVLVSVLPEAAVAPILIFIGLEITAQAFIASPPRHAPAIAISFVPAVAALVLIELNQFLAAAGRSVTDLSAEGQAAFRSLLVLGNGFVVTALLWGWALVSIVDGRLGRAAAVFVACAAATLFGLMHSPLPSGALFWPWRPGHGEPMILAAAYMVGAGLLLLFGRTRAAS
jgi:AGZA family xanthine/uracil permease-like MFS transporter